MGSVSTQINRFLNQDLNPVGESESHCPMGGGGSEKLLKSQELVFFLKSEKCM